MSMLQGRFVPTPWLCGIGVVAAAAPVLVAQPCPVTLGPRVDSVQTQVLTNIATGDFNGDGRADLITIDGSTSSGVIQVRFGLASGEFSEPVLTELGGFASQNRLRAFDLTGDGIPDVLCDLIGAATPRVLLIGRSDGTFQTGLSHGLLATTVAIGDLNADGRPDFAGFVLAGGTVTTEVRAFINQGGGQFTPVALGSFGLGGRAVITDTNFDGRTDILLYSGSATLAVVQGAPPPGSPPGALGAFTGQAAIPISSGGILGIIQRPVLLDVTGDGIPDIVGSPPAGFVGAFLVIHRGPPAPGAGYGPLERIDPMANEVSLVIAPATFADVNGDGRTDIVRQVALEGESTLRIMVKYNIGSAIPGAGAFSAPVSYAGGALNTQTEVAVGDFDGDGLPDVLADTFGGGSLRAQSLLRGARVGGFTIDQTPQAKKTRPGESAAFTVVAQAADPGALLSYAWSRNGVPLSDGDLAGRVSGARSATLTITGTQPSDSAGYTVTVSAGCRPRTVGTYLDCNDACGGADFNFDGFVDPDDLSDYISVFFSGC